MRAKNKCENSVKIPNLILVAIFFLFRMNNSIQSLTTSHSELPADAALGAAKDWIELFIRNEKITSPDSEISRNFHNYKNLYCEIRNS